LFGEYRNGSSVSALERSRHLRGPTLAPAALGHAAPYVSSVAKGNPKLLAFRWSQLVPRATNRFPTRAVASLEHRSPPYAHPSSYQLPFSALAVTS
jgi:hypothetical protein